jgi:hypothetical protein
MAFSPPRQNGFPSPAGFIASQTILIPTGGQPINVAASGRMFVCKESNGTFQMSFNMGQFFPMEVGLGFRLEGSDFKTLTFRNDTAADITVTFYTGVAEVKDARLNTLVQRTISTSQKNYPTFTRGGKGNGTISMAGNTTLDVTELATYTRKQIVVTNMDAVNDLEIHALQDDHATYCQSAFVPPRTAFTIETGGTVRIKNANGGVINIRILEVYYQP